MVEFGKEFGLDKDRKKLTAGDGKFSIIKIEMRTGKKDYEYRVNTPDGDKLVKGKLTLVHIDAVADDGKAKLKFYASNAPIVSACKEILEKFGGKDGVLKEPVHIEEVKEDQSEKGLNPYLYFS